MHLSAHCVHSVRLAFCIFFRSTIFCARVKDTAGSHDLLHTFIRRHTLMTRNTLQYRYFISKRSACKLAISFYGDVWIIKIGHMDFAISVPHTRYNRGDDYLWFWLAKSGQFGDGVLYMLHLYAQQNNSVGRFSKSMVYAACVHIVDIARLI